MPWQRTPPARASAGIWVFTGVWAAAETVSLALGPAIVGLILAVTGFISSEGGQTVTQPNGALTGIVLSFSCSLL